MSNIRPAYYRKNGFVPASIRSRSKVVTWLWRRGRLSYRTATKLARWLP